MSQKTMIICGIWVMGVLIVEECCEFLTLLIFANVACLCFLEIHFSTIISTLPAFPPAYEQKYLEFVFFLYVFARIPCSLIVGTPVQKKIKFTIIIVVTIQDSMKQPGRCFQIHVLIIYSWGWHWRYWWYAIWPRGEWDFASWNPGKLLLWPYNKIVSVLSHYTKGTFDFIP